MNDALLREILELREYKSEYSTLQQMGIGTEVLQQIYQWANQKASYGKPASYIPALAEVNPKQTAIAIGDLQGNSLGIGNGKEVKVSIQSVIKPFLYLYALEQGLDAGAIASIEATARHFNADPILQPESGKTKPGHPLNNAGAISSAGAINDFEDFLNFMRKLTGNGELNVIGKVFDSEMATNSNNRAIAYRLEASGRFSNHREAEQALEQYTRACAIGITVEETVQACLILASGGLRGNKRLLKQNHVVRTINVMNSYGLYEHTGEISLLAAGTRAMSCKSGVGGLIANIDPGRGAFCTYGACLDNAGNSVFGKYVLIPLNHLLAAPHAMRLSADEIIRVLEKNEQV